MEKGVKDGGAVICYLGVAGFYCVLMKTGLHAISVIVCKLYLQICVWRCLNLLLARVIPKRDFGS